MCVLEDEMKKRILTGVTILSLAVFLTVTMSGCIKTNGDMEEPDITVEYLSGEYADQLIRDGGECTLGTISITKDGDIYTATVNSMVIVESSLSDEGYYVADKNISSTVSLDPEARVTYIRDKENGPEIISLDEFIRLTFDDTEPLEEGNEKLYDVYTVGDDVMMILAKELPDGK